MIKHTIARADARRIYDQLGAELDRAARFEGQAKVLALKLLALTRSQRVLHVGVGTGVEHAALQHVVVQRGFPSEVLVGIEHGAATGRFASPAMLNCARVWAER